MAHRGGARPAATAESTGDAVTDQEIKLGLTERDTLLLTLLGEARGEEIEGRLSVGCVIRNRVKDDRWPDTIKDVCLQRWQFSCWNSIDPNYPKLIEHGRFLVSDHAIRSTFVAQALDLETRWVAEGLITGVVRDRVGGANHYMTRRLWESPDCPIWGKGKSPTGFIGKHVFFKL